MEWGMFLESKWTAGTYVFVLVLIFSSNAFSQSQKTPIAESADVPAISRICHWLRG